MTEDGITQRLERSLDRVRKELNEAIDDSQDAGEKLRSEIKTSKTTELSEDARDEATEAIDKLQTELDELQERVK